MFQLSVWLTSESFSLFFATFVIINYVQLDLQVNPITFIVLIQTSDTAWQSNISPILCSVSQCVHCFNSLQFIIWLNVQWCCLFRQQSQTLVGHHVWILPFFQKHHHFGLIGSILIDPVGGRCYLYWVRYFQHTNTLLCLATNVNNVNLVREKVH